MTFDAWQPALDRLVELGRKRGYITVAELRDALPCTEMPSEKVSAVMVMLSEMGVNIDARARPEDGAAGAESPGGPLGPRPLQSGAEAPFDSGRNR
ncbi:RNA polymerase sigma factor region1.1 domain-containing protein [Sabulicella glaciei]|uniref:RNA polymerase sigma factor 70 region 1.1 domain-containing protein n=1 Tax=Sabulicella glaciei TaxID=2984948 RepID=A0ABT3P097_9PROT|nr:RNA polymerase sigma factor region1.1 domain-containing protein [Roseococcus sp. MDT2-1-1]MCW8087836.1 hypothetical protein [Roseococcus sp. MDT2-1-1]